MKRKVGIPLATDEIRIKVLDRIENMYKAQERLLKQISINFNLDKALADLKHDMCVLGAPQSHKVVTKHSQWTLFDQIIK